jgi:class 3 adenylate cyclase
MPYDIVFILNQYLGRMSDAIIAEGGYVDKFMGDGILALFGMETDETAGARAALAAAAGISKAVAELNKGQVADLSDPMRIGIGIHTGECILGRIGSSALHEAGDRITALGDTVNTASRLEGHSKSLGVEVVVSQSTLDAAGIAADQAELTSVEVRGKEQTVPCLAVENANDHCTLARQQRTSQGVTFANTGKSCHTDGRDHGQGCRPVGDFPDIRLPCWRLSLVQPEDTSAIPGQRHQHGRILALVPHARFCLSDDVGMHCCNHRSCMGLPRLETRRAGWVRRRIRLILPGYPVVPAVRSNVQSVCLTGHLRSGKDRWQTKEGPPRRR